MIDAPVLLAGFSQLVRKLQGRIVARVLPVHTHGIHLCFTDHGPGLRLDTEPCHGAVLMTRSTPPRIRGGRGAWNDTVARLDRDLSGRAVGEPRLSLSPLAVEIPLPGCALLSLRLFPGRPTLQMEVAGSEPRTLPPDRPLVRLPESMLSIDDLEGVARAWRDALEGPADGLVSRLSSAVAGLHHRSVERLVRRAAAAADPAGVLSTLADRLDGADGPAWVSGISTSDPAARASHRELLQIELLPDSTARGETIMPTLGDAIALWYEVASTGHALARRRDAAARLVRQEEMRARRALAALGREEAQAEDPASLRRTADALLAAGPRATKGSDGTFEIPDVWDPSRRLLVATDARDPTAHAAAARLYARARRQERGREARRERRQELETRCITLAALAADAAVADLEPEIAVLESRLLGLGVAVGEDLVRVTGSAAPGGAGRGARVWRSPAGFLVLVGRSARQNDQLTFRTAAPDDLWFHVARGSGAHVVLRNGGRPVPDEDVRFAARLAACFSGAPRGEAVDVTVAARKHLRRPRGGAPGEVLVRRGETVRVRAEGDRPGAV